MCGHKKQQQQSTPAVVVQDPIADAAASANLATNAANQGLADTKKRRAAQSLYTMGAQGLAPGAGPAAPSLINLAKGMPGG